MLPQSRQEVRGPRFRSTPPPSSSVGYSSAIFTLLSCGRLKSGTVIELRNDMIEELKPQSDTLLSRLRVENIPQRILTIRGHRVMLDVDFAELYGVTTKRLNEAVRRNTARFPNDFMFQLAPDEVESLRSQFATSNGRGGRWRILNGNTRRTTHRSRESSTQYEH